MSITISCSHDKLFRFFSTFSKDERSLNGDTAEIEDVFGNTCISLHDFTKQRPYDINSRWSESNAFFHDQHPQSCGASSTSCGLIPSTRTEIPGPGSGIIHSRQQSILLQCIQLKVHTVRRRVSEDKWSQFLEDQKRRKWEGSLNNVPRRWEYHSVGQLWAAFYA